MAASDRLYLIMRAHNQARKYKCSLLLRGSDGRRISDCAIDVGMRLRHDGEREREPAVCVCVCARVRAYLRPPFWVLGGKRCRRRKEATQLPESSATRRHRLTSSSGFPLDWDPGRRFTISALPITALQTRAPRALINIY